MTTLTELGATAATQMLVTHCVVRVAAPTQQLVSGALVTAVLALEGMAEAARQEAQDRACHRRCRVRSTGGVGSDGYRETRAGAVRCIH